MTQEKIEYGDIMDLGFKEEFGSCSAFFRQYGFEYTIITYNLTKKIYLDWEKETQLCKLVRIDSPKTCNVKKESPIKNLEQIKELINFFSDKKEPEAEIPLLA